jgi:hypothetical protein
MTKTTFKTIIDLWPTYEELAIVIGVGADAVKQMRYRNSIPARYWVLIVEAAAEEGFGLISYEQLALLAFERRI